MQATTALARASTIVGLWLTTQPLSKQSSQIMPKWTFYSAHTLLMARTHYGTWPLWQFTWHLERPTWRHFLSSDLYRVTLIVRRRMSYCALHPSRVIVCPLRTSLQDLLLQITLNTFLKLTCLRGKPAQITLSRWSGNLTAKWSTVALLRSRSCSAPTRV